MAKENEKKVSGDMSSEELENVAGGWCMTGGAAPVKGIKRVFRSDNLGGGHEGYGIRIDYDDGSSVISIFDKQGNLQQTIDPSKQNEINL